MSSRGEMLTLSRDKRFKRLLLIAAFVSISHNPAA